ncbi:DUF488 domain-containing protein [Pseudonocardia parietis]|uniref:Uncharacterized protein YeaO (DUF488 family) n=1 Tax=Pseudonocardia parietis TaxID=570936 RepID=A0ABS4VZ39_9PSEU|nr:DUF488 family protein [Pseudonocardia parietis]MBP2368739.1 uncharacterized protein YeaO (DUF488 family) [Pseudonocardia parietis]
MTVQVLRIYDAPEKSDGTRVLVDGVWPRGVRKQDARYDEWVKDVAPSAELRKWYGHDPDRFAEFRRRYRDELDGSPALDRLREQVRDPGLILLTATRSPEYSHAEVLRELLEQ